MNSLTLLNHPTQAAPKSKNVPLTPLPYSLFHGPSKLPFSREWLNLIGGMNGCGEEGASRSSCLCTSTGGGGGAIVAVNILEFGWEGSATSSTDGGGGDMVGEVLMGIGNIRGEKTGGGSRPMRGVDLRGWTKGGVGDRGEEGDADAAFKSGDLGGCCGAALGESDGASRDATASGFEGANWPAWVTGDDSAVGGTFVAGDIGARTSVLGTIDWLMSDGASTAAGGGGGGATRVGFGGDEVDEDDGGRDEANEDGSDDS